jgi:hypothetical protein
MAKITCRMAKETGITDQSPASLSPGMTGWRSCHQQKEAKSPSLPLGQVPPFTYWFARLNDHWLHFGEVLRIEFLF